MTSRTSFIIGILFLGLAGAIASFRSGAQFVVESAQVRAYSLGVYQGIASERPRRLNFKGGEIGMLAIDPLRTPEGIGAGPCVLVEVKFPKSGKIQNWVAELGTGKGWLVWEGTGEN